MHVAPPARMVLTALLTALAASPAEATPPLVVVADVARLRQSPSLQAPTVARLQMGTVVRVKAEQPEWVQVAVPEHPGLEGWVASTLIDGVPTLAASRKRAWSAEGSARFVELAERVVAMDGAQAEDLKLLQRAYEAAGRGADAARVGRRLDGTEPYYLAVCRSGRALLAARVEPGKVIPLTEAAEEARTVLSAALREVDALPWWEATARGPVRQRGSAFARPQLKSVWNEELAEPGRSPELGLQETKLVLGKCATEGAVLATTPLTLLPRPGARAGDAERALASAERSLPAAGHGGQGAVLAGVSVERPFAGARFAAAAVLYDATWSRHHDDHQGRGVVWGLLDEGGRALPFGGATSLLREGPGSERWLARALGAGSGEGGEFVGVVDVEALDEGAPSGVQLILATPQGPSAAALCTFDRWGC